jgi:uncharacterized protein with PQ loop repeat
MTEKTSATHLLILPYTAVSVSIVARLIFMYLLYTKNSTNVYSLSFCYLSIVSSSLWIPYGIIVDDFPIIIRSGVEILLLSTSAIYILRNRCYLKKDQTPIAARAATAPTAIAVAVAASVDPPKSAKDSAADGIVCGCSCVQREYFVPEGVAVRAAGADAGHPAGGVVI